MKKVYCVSGVFNGCGSIAVSSMKGYFTWKEATEQIKRLGDLGYVVTFTIERRSTVSYFQQLRDKG